MTWKQEAFQHSLDHLLAYALPLLVIHRQVLSRVLLSSGLLLILVAPLWLQNEWFADLLSLLVDKPLPRVWNLLA